MSLKYELENWQAAVDYFDQQDFEKCLESFKLVSESSKIYFNIGMVYANISQQEEALPWFDKAAECDQFMAIAYFQRGVSNFLLGNMVDAEADFDIALKNMRGNSMIDYNQLGLQHQLYLCEVLFNRGLARLNQGYYEAGMEDLSYSRKNKQTEAHEVIEEAIAAQGDGFTVFSIPPGILYRPPEHKIRNVKKVDYLGSARVVASLNGDTFTGFMPPETVKQPSKPVSNGSGGGGGGGANKPSSAPNVGKAAILPPKDTRALAVLDKDSLSRQDSSARLPPQRSMSRGGTPAPGGLPGSPTPNLSRQNTMNATRLKMNKRTDLSDMQNQEPFTPGYFDLYYRDDQEYYNGNGKSTPYGYDGENGGQDGRMGDMRMGGGGGGGMNGYAKSNYPPNGYYNEGNGESSPPALSSPGSVSSNDSPQFSNDVRYSPEKGQGRSNPGSNGRYADKPRYNQGPLKSFSKNKINPMARQDSLRSNGPQKLPMRRQDTSMSARSISTLQGKLKVKCYHQSQPDNTRVLLVDVEVTYNELMRRIQDKFGSPRPLRLKYRDEENELVLMTDDDDLMVARTIAEAAMQGSDNGVERLEIYCFD
ncbi:uncharacterized protein VTP21DRAFT_145 [Calcarisporiella thermophila]|uniref:uncharacterized protein n=1 Tax=Calcarisporiella thermophila TaxID=911321 RepID=UPI0037446CE0